MTELMHRLRAAIESERARFGVPGCSVVIVKDGEVLLSEGFGLRDVDRDLPVTSRTLMPIGSSTKTFTAAVVASLVDEGLLDFDEPIRKHLPGFRMVDPVATELLSARDCLSHRSGLPRHDMLWYAGDGILSRDDVVAALEFVSPNKPFRQTWQYNNLLYITAGHLAGRLSGGSFEDAVTARLLKPLGMSRTNFEVTATQADSDHSLPHVRPIGTDIVKAVPFASLNLAGPAGNINSCADDLAPWLLTLLGQGVNGEEPLISAAVLGELKTTTMPMPASGEDGPARQVGYGLGLIIEEYRGRRLTHHGGNIDGFSSQVLTSQSDSIGIAVLTNLGASSLRDALPYVILDILDGVEDRGHGEHFKTRLDALMDQAVNARAHAVTDSKPYGPVRPFGDYAGTYRHRGYGDVVVALVDDILTAKYLGLPAGELQHRHLEVFDLALDLGGEEQRVPGQFRHDISGEVTALCLNLEPSVDPIEFTRLPATGHLTDELLNSLVGSYVLGPVTADISRRGDRDLVIGLAGQPAQPLTPLEGRTFLLQGVKLRFSEDGSTIHTPQGDFVRR